MPEASPRVAVVILNWNGWRDTIECLESVLRLDYPDYQVVVCDNGSKDSSLEKIKSWAAGSCAATFSADGPLRRLVDPPVAKPVAYREYDRTEAEAGVRADLDVPLVLIQTGANLGFAGGNNVGLRYVLAQGGVDYVWLLNNDTVVEADSLSELVKRMQARPDAGMCGSTLLYYGAPDTVQALGGSTYDKRLGVSRHLGVSSKTGLPVNLPEVEREMSYVVGASMLVSRAFLADVGLMSEDYFLYFEEIDWAVRGREKGYQLAFAPASVVYHKEGATIGSSHSGTGAPTSLRFLSSNRLLFTKRFHPRQLWRVRGRMLFEAGVYMKRRQFVAARIVLAALLGAKPVRPEVR